MNDTTTINQPEPITTQLITISKTRKAITTSLKVAEFFDKRHDHVLEDIKVLQKKCPPNFGEANYKDKQGKTRPMFEMDRTGFTLLAMGFTGEKALDFKIRYIQAFDAMEEKLMAQQKPAARIGTDRAPADVIPDEIMMGNPNTWAVWSWCLSRAVHDPCRKICGGVPVDLSAGEALFTEPMIAADLNLHRGVVRRCLNFLVKYGKITRRTLHKSSVLTISGWAERASREALAGPRPPEVMAIQAPVTCVSDEESAALIEYYRKALSESKATITALENKIAYYEGYVTGLKSSLSETEYVRLTEKAKSYIPVVESHYKTWKREDLIEILLAVSYDSVMKKKGLKTMG